MNINRLLIGCVIVGLSTNVWAALNAAETRIQQAVQHQAPDQIHFLKKIVNINSGTDNITGVKRVGDIVNKQLKSLGFKTKWVPEPAYMKRAPTLIAQHPGVGGKKILLIGHLDTVFSNQDKFRRYEQHKLTAKGPGVIDDKGGIAVMLYALKALAAAKEWQQADVTIVLTGDEENSGKPSTISRQPLKAAAQGCDVALDFEPTMTLDTLSISRRGVSRWTLTSHGNASHSATIFLDQVGDGAIFEMSRILQSMLHTFKGEKYLSFNPGVMVAGTTVTHNDKKEIGTAFGRDNVVAATAYSRGDYRYLSQEQKTQFETRLQALVGQHLPGTTSQVSFEEGIPAMPPTLANKALLQAYSEVSEDLGQGTIKPLDVGMRGAGDISHVASIVPANLVGLGPMGSSSHTHLETLDMASLPIQTTRAAIFIYRLSQGG